MRHITSFMRIMFAQSSRRHRIGKAHALFVMNAGNAVVEPATGWSQEKWSWVGFDDRGLELEVVAVLTGPATLLVIHVMPYGFRRNR